MKRLSLALLAVIGSAQLLHPQSTIFLVRHAEKAEGGDAKDPELSEAGHARAAALAAMLKDSGITAIYATEFKRTQQTAEPLARILGIRTSIAPSKETKVFTAKLKEISGNILIVGHSNTIPEILEALGVAAPPRIEEGDFDNLFVLVPGAPVRLLRLHY